MNSGHDQAVAAYLAAHDASCPSCGYQLRGVTRARCPECGMVLDVELLREGPAGGDEFVDGSPVEGVHGRELAMILVIFVVIIAVVSLAMWGVGAFAQV